MKDSKHFWRWRNEAAGEDGERTLEIGGVIAEESWYEDDVTPKMFRDELGKGTGPVTLWINSPGGDCIAASVIYTALRDYPGKVSVKISGIAASAASVIAMAGDTVEMSPTAMMMIHNPSTLAYGDHSEMKKAIRLLDEVKESIINAYELKTGLKRDEISRLMENETWMNAVRAVELGFADAVMGGVEQGEETSDSYSFSARMGEKALMNRIAARCEDVGGTSIAELEKRLNLLR